MKYRLLPVVFASLVGIGFLFDVSAQQPLGASSELARTAATTSEEKLEYAKLTITELQDGTRTIARLAEVARRDGATAEATSCITKKLSDIRLLLNVTGESKLSMEEALSFKEVERADHEFRKIAIARTKGRALVAEAYSCTGEEVTESGVTSVDVVSDDLLDDDFGNPDDFLDGFVDIPGEPGEETPALPESDTTA